MKKCQSKKEKLEYIMRKKTALAFYFAAAVTAGLVAVARLRRIQLTTKLTLYLNMNRVAFRNTSLTPKLG